MWCFPAPRQQTNLLQLPELGSWHNKIMPWFNPKNRIILIKTYLKNELFICIHRSGTAEILVGLIYRQTNQVCLFVLLNAQHKFNWITYLQLLWYSAFFLKRRRLTILLAWSLPKGALKRACESSRTECFTLQNSDKTATNLFSLPAAKSQTAPACSIHSDGQRSSWSQALDWGF